MTYAELLVPFWFRVETVLVHVLGKWHSCASTSVTRGWTSQGSSALCGFVRVMPLFLAFSVHVC